MTQPALSLIHGTPLEDEPGLGPLTIAGYLREVVRRHGPSEALVLRAGNQRLSWTYDELLARSLDVARSLVEIGVARDTRVGLLMTNRPEFLATLFGIALAGGVPVALSTFSTEPELDVMLKAAQVAVLLYEDRVLKKDFGAMLRGLEPAIAGAAGPLVSARYPFLRHLVVLGGVPGGPEPLDAPATGVVESWAQFLAHGAGTPDGIVLARADSTHPGDPGGVFFSSGTTSLPKGIVHSQRAFAIQWWRWPRVFAMAEPVRAWTGNGFFWSGNVSMVVGSALSTGGAVVLQRWFDEAEAIDLIAQERVSFANGRPHQWARFQSAPNWASADFSSLRYVPRKDLLQQHPTAAHLAWEVPMSFGTTETMTICTSRVASIDEAFYAGSMGAPLPGNTLKIIDPLTRELMPLGEKGEMCIKGPTLMSGYLGKSPEQCFDAEGFYCTGDAGHVDAQGRFFWDGRLTDMIKTGGANVAPQEIDDLLAKLPGVKRAQTVGVPDDLLGEIVVTCIVPVDGAQLAEAAIVAHLKPHLASFKLPRRVLFFSDADYALTGNEKIQAGKLRELAAARLDRQASAPA
ncbi:MAG: acyl--CoA ligase [Sphingomonadales bacterium]|nr:acyl--CoA ligase [Sphingomonadales bacterium]